MPRRNAAASLARALAQSACKDTQQLACNPSVLNADQYAALSLHSRGPTQLQQQPLGRWLPTPVCSSNPATGSHVGAFGSVRGIFGGPPAPRKFEQRRIVGWTPEQFYKVVADVDEYCHFVPWCQKSNVISRKGDGSYMEAELEVGFQLLKERYVSKVTLEAPRAVRSCVSNSLLFHHLDSVWVMEAGPAPNTCWLTFKVDFAFNSVLYTNLADLFFSEVVKQMVQAFEGRCQRLYGPSSLVRPGQAGRGGSRAAGGTRSGSGSR